MPGGIEAVRRCCRRRGGAVTPFLLIVGLAVLAGCSLRQFAVNAVGDALAAGGSVYEADADAALVGDALPFSVKLMDSLVAESPRHRGLLLAASRAYLLYAWAYVGFRAEQLTRDDVELANAARARASRLAGIPSSILPVASYSMYDVLGTSPMHFSRPSVMPCIFCSPYGSIAVVRNTLFCLFRLLGSVLSILLSARIPDRASSSTLSVLFFLVYGIGLIIFGV